MINLLEIPEEGRTFKYSKETAEVTETLQDLIGNNAFQSEFFIRPLNSKDFEMKGWIQSKTKEMCSYCGLEIQFPILAKFHEILIPPQEVPRDGRYAKPNHFSELQTEGPDSTEYQDQMKFDIGEYLHEAIALKIPFNPAPEITPKGDCSDCGISRKALLEVYEAKPETSKEASLEAEKKNPFSVLKGIKLEN